MTTSSLAIFVAGFGLLVRIGGAHAQEVTPFLSLGVASPEGGGEQYHVDLYKSGAAEYFGGVDVRVRGSVRYQLSKDAVATIIGLLKQAPLDEMGRDPATTVGRPSGWLKVDLEGMQKVVQFRALHERSHIQVFRDLQVLLDTERYRCPVEVKDHGDGLGKVDTCNRSIALLSFLLAQEKRVANPVR